MIAFLNRPTSITSECCFSAPAGEVRGRGQGGREGGLRANADC